MQQQIDKQFPEEELRTEEGEEGNIYIYIYIYNLSWLSLKFEVRTYDSILSVSWNELPSTRGGELKYVKFGIRFFFRNYLIFF